MTFMFTSFTYDASEKRLEISAEEGACHQAHKSALFLFNQSGPAPIRL